MEKLMSEIIEDYYKYEKYKLKPTTLLSHKYAINNHIIPFWKNKNIFDITINDYLDWIQYIENKGNSNAFNKRIISYFKSLYNYLSLQFDIRNIPKDVGHIITKYDVRTESLQNIWTISEYKKFIKSVDDTIYHVLFNILFFTGIRKGEALALTFEDVDFKNNTITINKTISKEHINGKRLIIPPKTKKSNRTIFLNKKIIKKIHKLKKEYLNKYGYYNNKFFIFGGIKPIPCTTLDRKKNYYCDKAKVKRIRIHDFRHSHATILHNYGVKPKVIQERLGHSSISTTLDTYVHLNTKKRNLSVMTIAQDFFMTFLVK